MSSHNQELEIQLVNSIRNGDKESEIKLAKCYFGDARQKAWEIRTRYSGYYTNSDIDDIVQELLFFMISKSVPEYDPKINDSFSAWVHNGWKLHHVGWPTKKELDIKNRTISGNMIVKRKKDGNGNSNTELLDTVSDSDTKQAHDFLIEKDTLENIFQAFSIMTDNDQMALKGLLFPSECDELSSDEVYLRRKGLSIISMSRPIPLNKHIDFAYNRSCPDRKRKILKQMANLGQAMMDK